MLFNRRAHYLVALLDDKHLEVVREKTLKIGRCACWHSAAHRS